ncbi:MAG: FAD-dependent oxidoreductase [Clostridia bacterium]|nr:FAD-dependent oxidoreductase [Clostridia bacterium]
MDAYELIIIGGGPAGMAAALEAYEKGLKKVLIIERNNRLGGILNQCIHNGFGLHYFKEELSGPEYASRFAALIEKTDIEVMCNTMVLQIEKDKTVHAVSKTGYKVLKTKSVILAMGCRERTRGSIQTPGARPAGVYTAGAAQKYVNIDGYLPGKRVVILGSGDIGLIMARRLTLEGAKVLACVEVMDHSAGLNRNIVQCLQDYGIPLYLSHTVTDVRGKDRVEQVVISEIDNKFNPIPGTEIVFDCDTLLLSVGLLPENELTRQAGIEMNPATRGPKLYANTETSMEGVFACGNVAHVHDLADNVSLEAQKAGRAAAEYVLNGATHPEELLNTNVEKLANYTGEPVLEEGWKSLVCITCPKGCRIMISPTGEITGNSCKRGLEYTQKELTAPERTITSSVKMIGSSDAARCPVRTSKAIPKEKIAELADYLKTVEISAPVKVGDIIVKNVIGTDADIIATFDF